ncbi:hypothetical protein OJAV_G00171310 [Oryzias javanicus]|uniref:Uncharacterized protein n=1 Tax=Oryzias javanicus TaxID=123683 RepID=A0A437CF73_ORYJA|nr:hypothetical protein OJAV_G00171310 [Oryzias javanicus]
MSGEFTAVRGDVGRARVLFRCSDAQPCRMTHDGGDGADVNRGRAQENAVLLLRAGSVRAPPEQAVLVVGSCLGSFGARLCCFDLRVVSALDSDRERHPESGRRILRRVAPTQLSRGNARLGDSSIHQQPPL